MKMNIIVIGFCLACLAGCSTVSGITARLNDRIDSLFNGNGQEDYVPVVYPAELARYPAERNNTAQPFFALDSSGERAGF
jgi:hypothetical protein